MPKFAEIAAPKTGAIIPSGQATIPTGPTAEQLANRVAATSPKPRPPVEGGYGVDGAPINRPVLTPPTAGVTPGVQAPRTPEQIYESYVNQGKQTLDKINEIYDGAIKSAKTDIDTAASKGQANQGALAAASGLMGSSAAIRGATRISDDAGGKKAKVEAEIRTKQAGDVANYLEQLRTASREQANTEAVNFPTLDAYYKSQAGNAFKGLAASNIDWDKFSSTPDYQDSYASVVSAFGGDPALAKLAFIAQNKESEQSQYLNQDPIQSADGSWIFLKQTTDSNGNVKIVPDKVDIGAALSPGESIATLGGKPYAITKNEDGTIIYRPLGEQKAGGQGFTLGKGEARYELNEKTGKYEIVGQGPAGSGGGGDGSDQSFNAFTDEQIALSAIPVQLRNTEAESKRYLDGIRKGLEQGLTPYEIADNLTGYRIDKPDEFSDSFRKYLSLLDNTAQIQDMARLINGGNKEAAITKLENQILAKQKQADPDGYIGESTTAYYAKKADEINQLLDSGGFFDSVGPFQGSFEQALGKFKGKDAQQIRTKVTSLVSELRNHLAGTSVTDSERDFLEPLIPSLSDKLSNFKVKVGELETNPLTKYNSVRTVAGLPELDKASLLNKSKRIGAYAAGANGMESQSGGSDEDPLGLFK